MSEHFKFYAGLGVTLLAILVGVMFYQEEQDQARNSRTMEAIADLKDTYTTSQDDLNYRIGLMHGQILEREAGAIQEILEGQENDNQVP